MRGNETAGQALRRLIEELEAHRTANGEVHVKRHDDAIPSVQAIVLGLPLVHGVNDRARFRGAIEDRALRPRRDLGMNQLPSESYLGLGDVVYTAAGFLYPDRKFAFVLAPSSEDNRKVEASPWDSASFCRSLCPRLPEAPASLERKNVFLDYTLPAPEYRRYLAHYIATCYRGGQDYLSPAAEPILSDPLHAICNNKFTSRVFEVRMNGSVPLETWSVERIFIPRETGDRASLKLRAILEPFKKKNKVEQFDGARGTLQDRVQAWLIERFAPGEKHHAG